MNTISPPLAAALSPWLLGHWFRLTLVLAGLLLVLLGLALRRRPGLAWSLGGVGAALACFGLGGLLFPAPAIGGFFDSTAGWLLAVGGGGVVLMVALLLM